MHNDFIKPLIHITKDKEAQRKDLDSKVAEFLKTNKIDVQPVKTSKEVIEELKPQFSSNTTRENIFNK